MKLIGTTETKKDFGLFWTSLLRCSVTPTSLFGVISSCSIFALSPENTIADRVVAKLFFVFLFNFVQILKFWSKFSPTQKWHHHHTKIFVPSFALSRIRFICFALWYHSHSCYVRTELTRSGSHIFKYNLSAFASLGWENLRRIPLLCVWF